MNSGITYLLWRSTVGRIRFTLRRLKSVKGFLLAVIGVLFFGLLLAPQAFLLFMHHGSSHAPGYASGMRAWGPLFVVFILLTGFFSGRGLYFRPAEINFLFPAPVHRRQLLIYLLANRMKARLLSSVIVAALTVRYAAGFVQGLAGFFLAMAFVESAEILMSLIVSSLKDRLGRPARVAGNGLLIAGFVLVLLDARSRLVEYGFPSGLVYLQNSLWMKIITAPGRPFVEVFIAGDLPTMLFWCGVCLAMTLATLVLALSINTPWTEYSMTVSARFQQRLDRVRRGGVHASRSGGRKPRLTLPLFPRLGGVGAIAWRQSLECLRNLRNVVMAVLMVMLFSAFPVYGAWKASQGVSDPRADAVTAAIPIFVLFVFTLLNTQALAVDFRRDLDRLPYLRSLPVSSFAVVVGELAPGVFLLTLLQSVVITALQFVVPGIEAAWALSLLLLLVPLNTVCLCVDNSFFLLWPYRLAPKATGDFQFMGRMMFVTFIKSLVLLFVVLLAGGLAAVAWYITGKNILVGAVSAMALLFAIALPLLMLTALAFSRFDVSREIPD